LGPVDHNERLFEKEAARQALFNYKAARNFRNIWYHYPEKFETFRAILKETWPGMDVNAPEINHTHGKPILNMFCPEERIPREIFWAGFGFQVWCQMLTHLVQSNESSIFLIDEPDIYLHSDLQRQLLAQLKNMGPDILIATHSTEIITEAETDDIVLIDKSKKRSKRIRRPEELHQVFAILGSNLNPLLTQLAKTRKAVFLEGKDFLLFSKFARKMRKIDVANRVGFAVIPIGGFSPDRIRTLISGIETTLGCKISSAAILDKDYRSIEECENIKASCEKFCSMVALHSCKEVENFILVPSAMDKAAKRRLEEKNKRSGSTLEYTDCAEAFLSKYAEGRRSYVTSQYLAKKRSYTRSNSGGEDEATSNERALDELNKLWEDPISRIGLLPGKDAVSEFNKMLQEEYKISVTQSAIVDSMAESEIPTEMKTLVDQLVTHSSSS
jgi:hypothetical protein